MQRIILKQLKSSVQRLQGSLTPDIEKYYQAYRREFKKYQKISSKQELLKAARNADVVFGADFHPFAQSQRTHLRILRELVKGKRRVRLALEAIDSQHQKEIDAYMSGAMGDSTFLKRIDYHQTWGFPWENYKVLFDLAKIHKIPVHGINRSQIDRKQKDLLKRDEYSAKKIAALRTQYPQDLIYVIYGDLHLASGHLPRVTRKCLGENHLTKFLTIFQNSETLYWRLAKRHLEERVDVLKLRSDAYCIVNAPPWLKWQAYLSFLESSSDVAAQENDIVDYTDQMSQFVHLIGELWGVEPFSQDFSVYAKGDGKLAHSLAHSLSRRDLAKVMTLIKNGHSFFVPSPPVIYLQSFDVNHGATLAGQYIHSKLCKNNDLFLNFPSDLCGRIWIEAVGFFASQLLNSRRKFATLQDLPSRHHITLLVLEQKLLEEIALRTGKSLKMVRRRRRKNSEYLEASRLVGAILGNKMYRAFHEGRLDQGTLHRWLRTPVSNHKEFSEFYMTVIQMLKNVPLRERSKNERL